MCSRGVESYDRCSKIFLRTLARSLLLTRPPPATSFLKRREASSIAMTTSSGLLISPGKISESTFSHLLSLYSTTQKAVYTAKVKDPKKLTTALKDHDWRYGELPAKLASQRSSSDSPSLEKDEMVRLTLWKIVHGAHRPFLPGMVRKNEPARVEETTKSAFAAQSSATYGKTSTNIPEDLDKALREVAQLHGVGPATATLVCSLYDQTNVPFFEDELIAWMCPDIPKVKYTWAEYKRLFAEVSKLRQRLGLEHKAVDVERVGFVTGHLDELDEQQRTELTKLMSAEDASLENQGSFNPDKRAAELPPKTSEARHVKEETISTKKRKSPAMKDAARSSTPSKPLAKRSKK